MIKWSSNSVLPEHSLFISSVFLVFSWEVNIQFSMLFQQLKHSSYFYGHGW